jgi:hypothetical protein
MISQTCFYRFNAAIILVMLISNVPIHGERSTSQRCLHRFHATIIRIVLIPNVPVHGEREISQRRSCRFGAAIILSVLISNVPAHGEHSSFQDCVYSFQCCYHDTLNVPTVVTRERRRSSCSISPRSALFLCSYHTYCRYNLSALFINRSHSLRGRTYQYLHKAAGSSAMPRVLDALERLYVEAVFGVAAACRWYMEG